MLKYQHKSMKIIPNNENEQFTLLKYQKRLIVSITEKILDYNFKVSKYHVNLSEYNKKTLSIKC